MNKKLLTLVLAALLTVAVSAQNTDTCKVFIYSPGQGDGLHIAVNEADT